MIIYNLVPRLWNMFGNGVLPWDQLPPDQLPTRSTQCNIQTFYNTLTHIPEYRFQYFKMRIIYLFEHTSFIEEAALLQLQIEEIFSYFLHMWMQTVQMVLVSLTIINFYWPFIQMQSKYPQIRSTSRVSCYNPWHTIWSWHRLRPCHNNLLEYISWEVDLMELISSTWILEI